MSSRWLFIAHWATAELGSGLCSDKITPILQMALVFARPRRVCSRDQWPPRGFGGEMNESESSSSKCGVKMSWESTALEAALQTEHGAKLKLVPETCHKYFKKKIIDLYIFL